MTFLRDIAGVYGQIGVDLRETLVRLKPRSWRREAAYWVVLIGTVALLIGVQ